MMGFVSLAGVVVNDSILLVQYIRHHLDDGDDIERAVVQASRERFRAVFLTSLTTAAGLLPLMLGNQPAGTGDKASGDLDCVRDFHLDLAGAVYDPGGVCHFI